MSDINNSMPMAGVAPRGLTIDQTTEVTCDKCNNNVFQDGSFLRRASKLITGAAKDSYIPIPTFVCSKCGEVNEEFIPAELKKIKLTL
jgi:hypothetical protein